MSGADVGLAALPAEARIGFIRTRLDAERSPAQAWRRSFTFAYGTLTVGQLAALPSTHGFADRATLRLGATASSLGVLALYALPLTVIQDAPRVSSFAAGADGRCAVLTEAEAALLRGAASETRGSGVKAHLGNLVVNAALSLAMGLGYHRWGSAAIQFGVGEIVGETQILTQPTGLISDLARYRAADLPASSARARRPAWSVAPLAARDGTGVTLWLEF
ncbi:MAG: hypothetical protein LAO51_11500 [Acidobacteriia bacterium]|nr:hypothetical protein [Terriglobia bacterium]